MSQYGFTISAENLVSAKMKEIEASLESMGVKAKVTTKEVSEHFEVMGERMTETFKNLKGLLLSGLGITALFEGWEFIEKSKEAFEGLEKAVTRVDTVLKSTKFAAGFSSEDIQNQAKELSKGIVAKRDEILDAQGMLLSFHSIRGDTFKETTKVVADFATFYKEDMTQAALQVGKAVNDPLKGMNRLVRMGVEFSQSQKDAIKNYTAQGNLVKAQAIILGELKTEFGGQAQAFALTDAGKIQVASKQWEEMQFAIGEIISKVEVSLIPSFTKIVDSIKTAFNSSVIQFFIEHIKDLVSVVLKLIPIWLAYKAIMFANNVITSIFTISNGILAASMGELTIMTDGSTLAMEGFSAAIASTGVGALVVGLGFLVEKMISVNDEFNKSIQRITRLDELTEKSNPTIKSTNDAATQYMFDHQKGGGLTAKQKGLLLNTARGNETAAKNELTENKAQISAIKQSIDEAKKAYEKMPDSYGNTENATPNGQKVETKNKIDELTTQMKGLSDINKQLTTTLGINHVIINDYVNQNKEALAWNKTHKNKRQLIDAPINPLTGARDDATHTSNLSGASGGLGQARVIQIHINTLQQNNGVKESKSQADQAIEKLTEMLNNFSDSQNSQ